ncbi:MAG: 50S ribosomal protein P1 [Candidatus Bathyarchaeia archaeon]|nr:50S ribosomal protein P1 [Candidatus Bathyarchaeota archaeon]
MQYMYAALLLHSAGKEITESSLENVLSAAGIKPDPIRVKALVAALSEVNIDEAIKTPVFAAAASYSPPTPSGPVAEKAEEKPKEEEKKEEEEDLQGLSALFG